MHFLQRIMNFLYQHSQNNWKQIKHTATKRKIKQIGLSMAIRFWRTSIQDRGRHRSPRIPDGLSWCLHYQQMGNVYVYTVYVNCIQNIIRTLGKTRISHLHRYLPRKWKTTRCEEECRALVGSDVDKLFITHMFWNIPPFKINLAL